MKHLAFLLAITLAGKAFGQCPASDASDISSGIFTITSACPDVDAASDITSFATFDIQQGGSLTINFTGGGLQTFNYLGSSFTVQGDGMGPGVDGIFEINDGNFALVDATGDISFVVQSGAVVNINGTTPNGNVIFGLQDSGNTTTVSIDGNINVGTDLTLSNTSQINGSGNITLDGTILDGGADLSGFTGNIPVELLYFSSSTYEKDIELEWSTASETNNEGFEIERSFDGINFEMIDFVEGSGSTNQVISYYYIDSNVPSRYVFYRLKQIDFDGVFDYSQTIMIQLESDLDIIQVWPTLVTDHININSSNREEKYKLVLHDLSGAIHLQVDQWMEIPVLEQILNNRLSHLHSSHYILTLVSPYRKNTFKLIKR